MADPQTTLESRQIDFVLCKFVHDRELSRGKNVIHHFQDDDLAHTLDS